MIIIFYFVFTGKTLPVTELNWLIDGSTKQLRIILSLSRAEEILVQYFWLLFKWTIAWFFLYFLLLLGDAIRVLGGDLVPRLECLSGLGESERPKFKKKRKFWFCYYFSNFLKYFLLPRPICSVGEGLLDSEAVLLRRDCLPWSSTLSP